MTIEQAIFTSAKTARLSGYQVVANSPGLSADQIDQLTVWAPAHDAMLPCATRPSVNFHHFDESLWCLSQTTRAGEEYSGRGGSRLYTHCLFVTDEILDRFSWQPFRLFDAAHAAGRLRIRATVPAKLPAFQLAGGASVVRREFLTNLTQQSHLSIVVALLDTLLLNAGKTASVYSEVPLSRLIDSAISLLPVGCRGQVSFTTGLRHSQQRTFAVMAAPNEKIERRRLSHQLKVPLHELDETPPYRTGWSELVAKLILAERFEELVEILVHSDPDIRLAELAEACHPTVSS